MADDERPQVFHGPVEVIPLSSPREEPPAALYELHHPLAVPPRRAHDTDAGYDLAAVERTYLAAGSFADVAMGVSLRLPPDLYCRLIARSSTWRRRKLLVLEGIIDPGYTGLLFAGVYNPGPYAAIVEPGERLAQLVFAHVVAPELRLSPNSPIYDPSYQDLYRPSTKPRGSDGFGSTGQ